MPQHVLPVGPSRSPAWAPPLAPSHHPMPALTAREGERRGARGGAAWPTLSHRPGFGAVLDAAAFQIG